MAWAAGQLAPLAPAEARRLSADAAHLLLLRAGAAGGGSARARRGRGGSGGQQPHQPVRNVHVLAVLRAVEAAAAAEGAAALVAAAPSLPAPPLPQETLHVYAALVATHGAAWPCPGAAAEALLVLARLGHRPWRGASGSGSACSRAASNSAQSAE